MAQKRMLDKKISVSEQVDNLSLEAKLIFTWSIPHSDDLGLLPFSQKTLKAVIVPMLDISQDSFGYFFSEIINNGLIEIFEYKGEKYYRIVKFHKHQNLRKDRKLNTILPDDIEWSNLEDIGIPLTDIDNQMTDNDTPKKSKVKVSEDKKEKKLYNSTEYLSQIPEEDLKEFTLKFNCNEKQIKSKADDLIHYCKSKGKRYSNYKSFLRNAIKNDFGERADVKDSKYGIL